MARGVYRRSGISPCPEVLHRDDIKDVSICQQFNKQINKNVI